MKATHFSTFLLTLFCLLFYCTSSSLAQSCSGSCYNTTLGDQYNRYSKSFYFLTGGGLEVQEPHEIGGELPSVGDDIIDFCVQGSTASLCPTHRLNISVYVNNQFLMSKSYESTCPSGGNDFYFPFSVDEGDFVKVNTSIVGNLFSNCTCKRLGNAYVKVCEKN